MIASFSWEIVGGDTHMTSTLRGVEGGFCLKSDVQGQGGGKILDIDGQGSGGSQKLDSFMDVICVSSLIII